MEIYSVIQHHLATVPPGEIFTTRQMLKYGERKFVDLALSRMVSEGKIRRLTFGVFCLKDRNLMMSPVVQKIVDLKSKGNCAALAQDISNLPGNESAEEIVFYTEGYSTSFMYLGKRVRLKKICGRKFRLSQTSIGRMFLALWITGKTNVDAQMVHDQIQTLSPDDQSMLRCYLGLLPGWLHDYLYHEICNRGL